jgi:hypothetical protein
VGIKSLILEADHTSPFNAWSYTSTSVDVFMVWSLIKYRYLRYVNKMATAL